MNVNPVLAPRHPKCRVCKAVASVEDVTLRLYSPELDHLPMTGAREYLQTVGVAGTGKQLIGILLAHRRHVDKFIARGGAVAPAQIEEGVTRIPPPAGDARWVDINQQGMDIGRSALEVLNQRLNSGAMEDKDVIAVAKIGQNAASKRADLEMKGALKRAESIAKLAAGFGPGADA